MYRQRPAPARISGNGRTEVMTDLAILKQELEVVQTIEIRDHNIEHVALELVRRL